jgi:hypothetical protein
VDWAAIGALFTGLGALLAGIAALRKAKREGREDCVGVEAELARKQAELDLLLDRLTRG